MVRVLWRRCRRQTRWLSRKEHTSPIEPSLHWYTRPPPAGRGCWSVPPRRCASPAGSGRMFAAHRQLAPRHTRCQRQLEQYGDENQYSECMRSHVHVRPRSGIIRLDHNEDVWVMNGGEQFVPFYFFSNAKLSDRLQAQKNHLNF